MKTDLVLLITAGSKQLARCLKSHFQKAYFLLVMTNLPLAYTYQWVFSCYSRLEVIQFISWYFQKQGRISHSVECCFTKSKEYYSLWQ